jgi:hypothetical protein
MKIRRIMMTWKNLILTTVFVFVSTAMAQNLNRDSLIARLNASGYYESVGSPVEITNGYGFPEGTKGYNVSVLKSKDSTTVTQRVRRMWAINVDSTNEEAWWDRQDPLVGDAAAKTAIDDWIYNRQGTLEFENIPEKYAHAITYIDTAADTVIERYWLLKYYPVGDSLKAERITTKWSE